MYQAIATTNEDTVCGLQPKISIWTTGGGDGSIDALGGEAAYSSDVMKEVAGVYKLLSPLFKKIKEVLASAIKAVSQPTAPLFDRETKTLRPRCMRALKRIFFLFDVDKDGALNDQELNEFQVRCFSAPLIHAEIKRMIQEKLSKGVNEFGVTLEGFRFLHSLFIQEGRIEHTWFVLRKFGYNNELKLKDDYLSTPTKKAPDQSVELKIEALEFSNGVFNKFDYDKDGVLRDDELEDLFSTASEWDFPETYIPTISEKYDVNVINQREGNEKTLILREIPKDGVEKLLS